MKSIILLAGALMLAPLTASADPDHMDGRADLMPTKHGNLHMGVVDLGESGERNAAGGEAKADLDIIKLPECQSSKNEPVTAIRFYVPLKKQHGKDKGRDNKIAYVESFTVVYDNGMAEEVQVRRAFNNIASAEGSNWFDLKGNQRCVRVIAVNGEEFERNRGKRNSAEVHVIGKRVQSRRGTLPYRGPAFRERR